MRGHIDFAMNGMERTPDREAMFRLSRPYYVFRLQFVVRRDETRIQSLDDCKRAGIRVGTLGDTAASRLLTQEGIVYRTYDSQTTPYKDLEQGQLDAVLLDLPIAMQYTKRDPQFNTKLKFAGKPIAPGLLCDRLPQGERSAGRPVRRGHRASSRQWHAAEDLRSLGPVERRPGRPGNGQTRRNAPHVGHPLDFCPVLPPSPGGAAMTVSLTVLGFLLAMAIGLPVATARLYGPAPLRWVATIYVEFFRGSPSSCCFTFSTTACPRSGWPCTWAFRSSSTPSSWA